MLQVLSACAQNLDKIHNVLLNTLLEVALTRYCLDLADHLKNAILK